MTKKNAMSATSCVLCIAMPFEEEHSVQPQDLIEAQIQMNWRTYSLKFVEQTFGVVHHHALDVSQNTTWLALLNNKYCSVQALFKWKNSSVGPLLLAPIGIRIILNIVDILSDYTAFTTEFMEFESDLARVLYVTPYILERKNSKRSHAGDCTKVYDVKDCVKIHESGFFYSFKDLCFSKHNFSTNTIHDLPIHPTYMVSTCYPSWRSSVLDNIGLLQERRPKHSSSKDAFKNGSVCLDATHAVLIVTNNIDKWAETCAHWNLPAKHFAESLVSVSEDLTNLKVILTTVKDLQDSFQESMDLEDTVNQCLSDATEIMRSRSPVQIRRYIIEVLCKKYSKFRVAWHYIQFGSVVLDDCETLLDDLGSMFDALCTSRKIHIFQDASTKPLGLTHQQVHTLFPTRSLKTEIPLISDILHAEQFQSIAMPKNLLKKFKLVSHQLKISATEERIDLFFKSKYCPIEKFDALQRFSNKKITLDCLYSLIEAHFTRMQISLGCFLEPAVETGPLHTLQKQYLMDSCMSLEKQCCICLEKLQLSWCISVCGHLYCEDCKRHNFVDQWSVGKSKACSQCRCPIILGDMFDVSTDPQFCSAFQREGDPVTEQIFSFAKELRRGTFLRYTKQGTVTYIDSTDLIQFNENEKLQKHVKHIVVEDISCLSPSSFLRSFNPELIKQPIMVHLFYAKEETQFFYEFVHEMT